MATELWAVGLVLLGTILGSSGPIFLKKASNQVHRNLKSLFNWNFVFGVGAYGLGTVLFIPALKGGDLSVLYPLVSVTYVWVSLLSVKFLGEKMNTKKWMGIGFIILGVAFIGMGS